ncbi:MAG: fibronectin type III domain-containing protein [Dehalobacter sp.]|nr:fibronectin type III domain-containing protein [Dehalobacter sp.]
MKHKTLRLILCTWVILCSFDLLTGLGNSMGFDTSGLMKAAYAESSIDSNAVIAATGADHSLCIQKDGTVKAWGRNIYGQLGTGNTTAYYTPTAIPGLTGVKQLSAGLYYSLALMNDGTVKAWGYNCYGQLGTGNTADYNTPTIISGLTGVKQISAGTYHSLALMNDGTVKAWGNNSNGELGMGTTAYYTPTTIPGLTGVKAVVVGHCSSYAIMNDGTVKSWGNNAYGQLGNGNTSTIYTPTTIPGLANVKQLVTGLYHAVALINDGTVKAWGYGQYGQLGIGNSGNYYSPTQVTGLTDVKQVSACYYSSFALLNDGTAKAWGYGAAGDLGTGNYNTYNYTPITIPNLSGIRMLISGHYSEHSIALMNDGSVKSWGYNGFGQLGNGGTANASIPGTIPSLICDRPPLVAIITPISNSVYNASASLNLSVSVSDPDDSSLSCSYYLDSETTPRETQAVSNTNSAQTVNFSTVNLTNLAEGKHTLYCVADDGTFSAAASVSFTWDKTVPDSLSITETSSTSNSVSVTGGAKDNVSGFDSAALRYTIGENISPWLQGISTTNITSLSDYLNNNSQKVVKLSNGWLIYSLYSYTNNRVNFYCSKNSGVSWDLLCYLNISGSVSLSICSFNNNVYFFTTIPTISYARVWKFDASTITQGSDISSSAVVVDAAQNIFGPGCSITSDNSGILYTAWCNNGIRYSKSTDGGITWQAPTAIIGGNGYTNPSILINSNGYPAVIFENALYDEGYGGYYHYIYVCSFNGSSWSTSTAYASPRIYDNFNMKPIVITDKNNVIHLVWQSKDTTDSSYFNLWYSKSTDGGSTWSTATKLTSGNLYDQNSPVLTYDESNKVTLLWTAKDASNTQTPVLKQMSYTGTWGPAANVLNNGVSINAISVTAYSNLPNLPNPLLIYANSSGTFSYTDSMIAKASYTTQQNPLLPNKTYTIKLEAKDKAGNIASTTKEILTKAEKPTISAKPLSTTSLELTITDTNPANTEYQIYCGDKYVNAAGELTVDPDWYPLTTKKIVVSGLNLKTQYLFQVKARNAENIQTDYSEISAGDTYGSAPEGTVSNIKLTSGTGKITITWDPMDAATGYDIEIDGAITDNGARTTYENTFTPGQDHLFRIRPKNETGAGDWSNVITGRAKYALAAAPANLTAAPAGTSVTITWDAVAGALSYDLEFDGVIKNVKLNTSYKSTGLKPSTQHTYRVRTRNVQGAGEWSTLKSVMTTGGLPGAPAGITYTATNTTATINWTAATDAETYEIVEIVNGQETRIVDNNTPTTCEKRGLTPNSTHIYKIRGVNSIGAGTWSDPITITTYLLDTPSGIRTDESDTSIILTWNAVQDATSYQITLNTGTPVTSNTTTYTFTGLTPETKYSFQIKAVSATGESGLSDVITTYATPVKPAIPQNVNATVSDTLITITWDAVENAEGYDVELDGILMEDDDDPIYIHDGLESDTLHAYRVRARNAAIEGDWSAMQYIKTLPGKPAAPANIEVKSSSTGATLTWNKKDSDQSFDIEISDGTTTTIVSDIAKNTFTHRRTGLGREYTYRIRTHNMQGVSEWSGKIINNALKAWCKKTKTVDLGLTAKDITDFSPYTMVVTYNAAAIDVIDLSTLTGIYETVPGRIEGTDITITEFKPGEIVFVADKVINPGEAWTGVLNSIKFKAKATGGTTITYTVFSKQDEPTP